MIRAAVDRARPTRGGMVGSTVLHVLLIFLLTLVLRPQTAVELAEELTKISYIEAHLGENLAQKIELKTLAKRTPPSIDPGQGISTRSAVKPSPPTELPPSPRERTPRTQVAEVAPALPTPAERKVPELDTAARLQSRDEQMAKVELPQARTRAEKATVDASGPSLAQRRDAVPTIEAGAELRSRDGALSVVGGDIDPKPRGGATREVADAAPGTAGSGGSLQGARNGAAYQAPGAALQPSRGSGPSLAEGDAGAIAPPSGGGSVGSGRRTILDYGSGGGSGGLRSRGGGAVPAPERPVEPGRTHSADKGLAEATPVQLDQNGTGMSITGQIAGRKILELVAPEYTARARQQGWEGTVAVHFTVLPDGRVKDNTRVQQMSQHRDLNQAAMDAIKKFRFAPLPAGDAQVEQWGVITFVFRLK